MRKLELQQIAAILYCIHIACFFHFTINDKVDDLEGDSRAENEASSIDIGHVITSCQVAQFAYKITFQFSKQNSFILV